MGEGITEPQGGLRGTGREEPHSESGGTQEGERTRKKSAGAEVLRGLERTERATDG